MNQEKYLYMCRHCTRPCFIERKNPHLEIGRKVFCVLEKSHGGWDYWRYEVPQFVGGQLKEKFICKTCPPGGECRLIRKNPYKADPKLCMFGPYEVEWVKEGIKNE